MLETYSDIGAYSEILGASRYRQIQLLLEKVITELKSAITALEEKNIDKKCTSISKSNDIVLYLRECLDFSADKALATRLDGIYGHVIKLLFNANAKNNADALTESLEIMTNVSTWWNNVNTD